MTRDDIKTFWTLEIDHSAIGLEQAGAEYAYFCTPAGAEVFACLGCDGVHFALLPGDEKIYCVDPAMGEPGTYVLPVAADFRQFLSYVLFCGDANPIAQILSVELMLRYSFGMDEAADELAAAVTRVLDGGWRTVDIADDATPADRVLGTSAMGDKIVEALG